MSNASSNSEMSSASSSTDFDVCNDDASASTITDATNDYGYDVIDSRRKRSNEVRARRTGTTIRANYSQALDDDGNDHANYEKHHNDEEHANNEEHASEQ